MESKKVMTRAHLVGHRGARAEAPENTLGGFQYLRSLGINKVELDLHISSDNKLMVIHDTNTLRTTGLNADINTLSSKQLRALNATADGKVFWKKREKVPELYQVLSAWAHLEHIQIEVKPLTQQDSWQNIAQQLNTTCQKLKLSRSTTVITSSDQDFIRYSRSINPLPHGLVAEALLKDPIADAKRLGCELIALQFELYTEDFAKECIQEKIPVSLWTVNDADIANTLIQRGASSVITDHPGAFLQWINKRP